MLVHIANEDETASIRRSGIRQEHVEVTAAEAAGAIMHAEACLPAGTYKSRILRQRFYDRD